jgi:hypothetical protein
VSPDEDELGSMVSSDTVPGLGGGQRGAAMGSTDDGGQRGPARRGRGELEIPSTLLDFYHAGFFNFLFAPNAFVLVLRLIFLVSFSYMIFPFWGFFDQIFLFLVHSAHR